MVDDHPLTLRGYELSLSEYSERYSFEFYKAHDSAEALTLIEANEPDFFHITFLDIRLPVSSTNSLINGEELGMRIKKTNTSKIVVLSSINDNQRIYSILNNLQPHAFIVKTEATPELLLEAIDHVLMNKTFYSPKIKQLVTIQKNEDPVLDIYDIKILYFISIGEKMKNLPDYVHLSIASIERRKKKIKTYLGNIDYTDRELIEISKKKGYI